jgi:hypothetical protein
MIQARLKHLDNLLDIVRERYLEQVEQMLQDEVVQRGCMDIDELLDGRGQFNVSPAHSGILVEVRSGLTDQETLLDAVVTILLELQRLERGCAV